MTVELRAVHGPGASKTLADASPEMDDRLRPLTPAERQYQDLIYQRLLKVMDLSLIGSLEDREARRQIREICEKLITEEQAPLSVISRQRIVKRIEDEVL